MVQILIRPPEALKENLKREARRMGITLNAIVLQILWEWVENRKQEESSEAKGGGDLG